MTISTVQLIEDAAIGIRVSKKNFTNAARANNRFCMAESGLEASGSFSQLLYYLAWIPDKFHTYDILLLNGVTEALAIVGIAANAFKFGKETLSFARQQQFLTIFTDYAWSPKRVVKMMAKISKLSNEELSKDSLGPLFKAAQAGDPGAIEKTCKAFLKYSVKISLEKIAHLDNVEIERALPEWLFKKITDKGGKKYFEGLIEKVNSGDQNAIDESVKLLETMRSYAEKKTIVHVVGMVSAIVGIAGCIGLLIAFPLFVTILLLAMVVILGVTSYAVKKGYVENSDGGFSLDLCIPEFLKKKADPYNDLAPSLQRVSALVLPEQKTSALFDSSKPEYRTLRQGRVRSLKVSPGIRENSQPAKAKLPLPPYKAPTKHGRRLKMNTPSFFHVTNF